jgi:hypothetical protein
MNQTHTAHEATLADFYAGDWVDKLDEAKINIDERDAIATSGAFALGRKVDSQIDTLLAAADTDNVTTNDPTSSALTRAFLRWRRISSRRMSRMMVRSMVRCRRRCGRVP